MSDPGAKRRWSARLAIRKQLQASAAARLKKRQEQVSYAQRVLARMARPFAPTRMFDSVDVATVPPDAKAVAGYTAGNWPTYGPLVRRFPKARHVSIAIAASYDADCLDTEPGDATPQQVPAWVRRQHARGVKRPIVYTSVSQMPYVIGLLANAGISRDQVKLWAAHYTHTPHICGPQCGFGLRTTVDATQFTDKALGRNLDESACTARFWS